MEPMTGWLSERHARFQEHLVIRTDWTVLPCIKSSRPEQARYQ
jgi:hypothetical protein